MTTAAPSFAGTERFAIRRRIGVGGMGIVYEAWDGERGEAVALKTLRSTTPASIAALKQEFRGLAGVAHPNLVALHELHAAGDTWFFTMELLDGVDLATYVGGDEARLRSCLAQLAQGVHALHAAGRLHRDIKPSNLIVTAEPRVVLLDFGVIAEIGGRAARGLDGDEVVGTPAYMAPEQARGVAGPASDWYAVGVVLHELLTGTRPFRGTGRAILFDKNRYDPQPVRALAPDAPADLARLCDALLARDPAARPTAPEILRALDVTPPPAPARPGAAPLVGRDAALAALRGALAGAERGAGSVVYVRGASGMGKSTLVHAFLDEARRDGAVVLAGRCYQQESVPYKAVDELVDALAAHLAALPRHEADAVLPRDILLLAQVFPALRTVAAVAEARRRAADAEPHERRRRAFAALRELLTRIAEGSPLVLFVDDVQWGDADSAPILDALVQPPDPPALVLVLAYRAEDAGRGALLRALLRRRERIGPGLATIEVPVEPLAPAEARALAAALGAGARADAIARESGGVPYFVHELALGGAASVEGLIAARALAADERAVLELVAQAGKPIARAIVAAALGAGDLDRALARLGAARLVRGAGEPAELECYHDRIREAVVAALPEARRRDLHARLARALAAAPAPDLEALVVHCDGAGDREAAAEYALRAADQASAALAFDRAAGLYRRALELGAFDAARTRAIRARLGEALSNAGDGGAAAEAYLAAALDAPAADALELRRRAASESLRSGRVDGGLRILGEVLAEVGGRLPPSPRRAMASLVLGRARLRLRGLDFARRDATQISAYDLARLDVLRSAATDLGMVDLVVGADFGTRQLLLALALGEPLRIARALAVEAMFLAAQGARTARRTADVIARAEALVGEIDDPQLPAWLAAARGLAAYQAGRFRLAAGHAEDCVRRLRECTGVVWETGGVEVQVLWSLWHLGELRELSARVDALVEQARLRGNRFDEANLCAGLPALAWAVADRTADGRAEVAHALAQWSPRGFHLQHYYELLALASFDLYDGDGAAAAARLDATWPALRRSRLLMCPSVAIEAWHLRARAAIATGRAAEARAAARALAGWRGHPWAEALVALTRAGFDRSAASLDAAIEACARADLRIYAAAARRRRAALVGDPDALTAAGDELTREGVRDPDRFTRMLVPL